MDIGRIKRIIESGVPMDLHIHSCYSDGMLTPEQIVDRWAADGYKVIAICDHDGIEGSMIGWDYAKGMNIDFITGIEFDSENELGKDLHILGYGIDYHNDNLLAALRDIRIWRAQRNDMFMAALNENGCGITLDDIGTINEGRYIGKPTFARIMVNNGVVASMDEAFAFFKSHQKIDSIHKSAMSSKFIVDTIHKAGGLAVLAHPMEQKKRSETWNQYLPRLYKLLDCFTDYGIDGIECWHPSATDTQSALLAEYAQAHGLIMTRGSDFHLDNYMRDYSRFHDVQ